MTPPRKRAPGAGRKAREFPRVPITVRLEPHDAAKLRTICHARKLSQSKFFTEKIRKTK
jgi:hypothetical protein